MDLYHVIYRGVDGRQIFMDDQDRARFVHNLYEFNDAQPAPEFIRRSPNVGRATSHMRERIVDVHGWKFMSDHVHLLLSPITENGLSLFSRKMTGYGRYFNERHERHGVLFDRTKKVPVRDQSHFLYVLHYLHLNGLDDLPGARDWRERDKGSIRDVNAALRHLKADKWSSFRDYCGERNFPSILTKTLFESSPGGYERDLQAFLDDRTLVDFDPATFE
jgi:putative transposase